MGNPPPSPGSPTDPSATLIEKRGDLLNQEKTEARNSKLIGKKRRNLETKKILKKLKRVKKMAKKAGLMRAETSSLMSEMAEMETATDEKKKELKLEKEKRDGCLAEMLPMLVTEHVLRKVLCSPSQK